MKRTPSAKSFDLLTFFVEAGHNLSSPNRVGTLSKLFVFFKRIAFKQKLSEREVAIVTLLTLFVNTVYIAHIASTAHTVYTVYTIQTALHCLNHVFLYIL